MTYKLPAIIDHEGDWYVAQCPQFDIASQGRTIEEAMKNLREAVELFLETADPKEIPVASEPPFITTFEVSA